MSDLEYPRELEVARRGRGGSVAGAWMWALAAVLVVAIGLTVGIVVVEKERRAQHDSLHEQIKAAREEGGAPAVVLNLTEYLQEERIGRCVETAEAALADAYAEIDDLDMAVVEELERAEPVDLDAVEAALLAYLEKHPEGNHRRDAERRLRALPLEHDRQAFGLASAAARDAGDDLKAVEAAWRQYLDAYPDGIHSEAARAAIADLPDRADRRLFASTVAEGRRLADQGRLTDAILHLERGMSMLRTAARRNELAAIHESLEKDLERSDAARCLVEPAADEAGIARQVAHCDLYLTCYPDGPSASEVARRLEELRSLRGRTASRELLRQLRSLGSQPARDFAVARRLVADSHVGDPEAVKLELVRLLWIKEQAVLAGLEDCQEVLLEDERVLTGVVTNESGSAVSLLERTESGAKPTLLVRKNVRSIAPLLASTEWARIRDAWGPRIVERRPVGGLVAALRGLERLLPEKGFADERGACMSLIAVVDPDAPDAQSVARRLGLHGLFNGKESEDGSGSAQASSVQDPLADVTASFRTEAVREAESRLDRLPDSHELTIFGTPLNVMVEWFVLDPKVQRGPARGASVGLWKFVFPYKAARRAVVQLPDSVRERVDSQLRSLGQSVGLVVEFEVRVNASTERGIGAAFVRRDGRIVVQSVIPGTPAESAGIRPDDQIVRIGERWVTAKDSPESVAAASAVATQGIELSLIRDGRRYRANVVPTEYRVRRYEVRDRIVQRSSVWSGPGGRDWSPWRFAAAAR